jgi:hypothetical protein
MLVEVLARLMRVRRDEVDVHRVDAALGRVLRDERGQSTAEGGAR